MESMRSVLFLTTFLCSIYLWERVASQDLRTDSIIPTQENPCLKEKTTTCGQCIAISTKCAFCADPEYDTKNYPRCDLLTTHEKLINDKPRCQDIINPPSVLNKTKDIPLFDGDRDRNAEQIKPQQIDLELRPNDPQTFELEFRLAQNYPVDLYYLMDLSNSMKDDKENLANLGIKIAEEMNTLSNGFKLGFGSFVDKPVMPYVSTAKNKINNPCQGCEKAYGFRNVLALNQNATFFKDKVGRSMVSGNLDAPEGGFDAIMQALACESQIGWRDRSRRMLLFSTDSGFHYAGDGKLGGILKQNDGLCHLAADGMYTESSNQDYPSISQVGMKAKDKNFNIIFAVTSEQKDIYDQLKPYIAGSETGELASDSNNIVKLIRDSYLAITSKVELIVENSDNVEVKFQTKCKGNTVKDTNRCENLSIGDLVKFNVTLEVKNCPPTGQEEKTLRIKPVGLYDTLTVKLKLKCQCDCESAKNIADNQNHAMCNFNGTYVCGMCMCNDPYYGDRCGCNRASENIDDKNKQCIQAGTSTLCNGRGECSCGRCKCRERQEGTGQFYTGSYCECDDYGCPYYSGLICGGPSRGVCNCGQCVCKEGFKDGNCGCKTDNSTCMYSGKLCNGRGECECGKCKCNPKYFGSHCQECDNCAEKQCSTHRDCALCKRGDYRGLSKEDCHKQCVHTTAKEQITLKDDVINCEFVDDNGCFIYFAFSFGGNYKLKVEVQKNPVCPEKPNVLAIVLGVLAGLVVLGILVVLGVKFGIDYRDYRIFQAFLEEVKNAKWEEAGNPLYRDPVNKYQNPTYGGK
ncbi:integrin beta-PS-like [Crassostrea virginica]